LSAGKVYGAIVLELTWAGSSRGLVARVPFTARTSDHHGHGALARNDKHSRARVL